MNDGLVSLDNDEGIITATVSFTEGSTTFKMEPHIELQSTLLRGDGASRNFISQHGELLETFILPTSFSDDDAEQLEMNTQWGDSRIATVGMIPNSLSIQGLKYINSSIMRAPHPPTIRLFLDSRHERIKWKRQHLLLAYPGIC